MTFDTDGGLLANVNDERDQSVSEGNAAHEPNIPTKEGYKFIGWYVGESDETYDFQSPVTADVTLKARWREANTVTFVTGLDGVEPITAPYEKEEAVLEPDVTEWEGVKGKKIDLVGWFTDEACTEPYEFGKTIASSIRLYAKWTATVIWKDDSVTPANPEERVTVVIPASL